jgi:hypothetical protein
MTSASIELKCLSSDGTMSLGVRASSGLVVIEGPSFRYPGPLYFFSSHPRTLAITFNFALVVPTDCCRRRVRRGGTSPRTPAGCVSDGSSVPGDPRRSSGLSPPRAPRNRR